MSETLEQTQPLPVTPSLQTRGEHSRSMEDAEKYRALQDLRELGLIIPLSQTETFHGRVAKVDEGADWSVDPSFSNGGNDSGNRNINIRSTLYTGQKDIAQAFADERAKLDGKQSRAEIHEIVSADTDATVIDIGFDPTKLNEEDRAKYHKALRALVLPITEGSPVSFEDRDKALPFITAVGKAQKTGYLLSEDVTELADAAKVDERVALQMSSAYNASKIALTDPVYLAKELLGRPTDIFTYSGKINGGDENQDFQINLEYVQRFLREAHIVGVKQEVESATLGRSLTSISFFDLEKVYTSMDLEKKQQKIAQKLGGIATTFSQLSGELQPDQPLNALLEDPYAKPGKLIEAAKKVEGYDSIFEGDAGNWEGFSLAEHTETVLRNFDENFADELPVEMLSPMRLAILAHDVGKPIAVANNEKEKQKEYNAKQASDFFDKLGVDDKLKNLLLVVIGDGAELSYKIDVKNAGEPAKKAMAELATKTLSKFYDTESVTDDQISGFTEMCKMLQICDGGAYTSMAVTNREGKGRHRNAPSFNGSFAQPVGPGKRSIKLSNGAERTAARDLTPQSVLSSSRT